MRRYSSMMMVWSRARAYADDAQRRTDPFAERLQIGARFGRQIVKAPPVADVVVPARESLVHGFDFLKLIRIRREAVQRLAGLSHRQCRF